MAAVETSGKQPVGLIERKREIIMLQIKIQRTACPKAKPADESKLGFGKLFTDHMFVMDYTEGQGWHDARIVPYGPFQLDPATVVFHYAQEIFERSEEHTSELQSRE